MSGAVVRPIPTAPTHVASGRDRPWPRLLALAAGAALLGEAGSFLAARGIAPAGAGAGSVLLAAGLLHFRHLPMAGTGALVALVAWFTRAALGLAGLSWNAAPPGTPGPETLFGQYVLLGLLLQTLGARRWLHAPWRLAGCVAVCQFAAGAAEVVARQFWNLPIHLPALIEAGLVRSLAATGLVYIAGHAVTQARWQETQALNNRLWLLIIRLETEAFFLRKSAADVERVTAQSYELYHSLREQPDAAGVALEIAKDVHELKTDYQRILAGLDQVARYREVSRDLPFSSIVSLVIAANREYAKRLGKSIALTQSVNHDFVTADYAKWVSILNNLVTNAVEACPSDGHVHVEATLYPHRFIVSVSDDGPGIPPQDWELVFHPGFSTKANPVTGTYSVGLGLTHARSLVQALGGRIYVEDSGSAGTIFRVEFPPALVHAEAAEHDPEGAKSA